MNPPFIYFWRCKEISREAMINEEIRAKELRVIAADGTQLGIMSREEALALSEEKRLDLVCISPKANPPVCKILDYGKYKYELQKKEKEAKKKQKTTQVKEIRLSTFIEDHDIMVKAKTFPRKREGLCGARHGSNEQICRSCFGSGRYR